MKISNLIPDMGRFPESTVTFMENGEQKINRYDQVLADIHQTISKLSAAKLVAGDILIFSAKNSYFWILWGVACVDQGVILLSPPDHYDRKRILDLAEQVGAKLICSETLGGRIEVTDTGIKEQRINVPNDVFTMGYSSGTTGRPKGIFFNTTVAEEVIEGMINSFGINSEDRHVIFLPFSNAQQRAILYGCLSVGVSVTISSPDRIFADIQRENPSFLIAPPVFFENLFLLSQSQVSPDNFLKAVLGGEIRFMISGMAPLRKDVAEFFIDVGVPVLEAYGMSETGMLSWNTISCVRAGSVGIPIPNKKVTVDAETGEIVVCSDDMLASGYFDLAPGFVEPSHEQGFRTGDIGYIDDDGFLFIKGRIKDIIVTSSGHKICPSDIEHSVLQVPGVKSCIAFATHDGNIAAVVECIKENHARVERDIGVVIGGFLAYQKIDNLYFVDSPLVSFKGFYTNHMKIDRNYIAEYFREHRKAESSC